ncbi:MULTISPECIES: ABC transporter ATP-binding protein [Prauserella salsuginis group]|uniref:ABC-type multidrug transport system fused ATPase/permease subunit n=2 Tax=Prauserella salsuginis group TaxID=2893672 RepID=A0A839XSI7_9PSEU|nr:MULTISPECIES: ABC transporter ATP-binding protein [Prauserella salsuginis group]MBB3666160.1 ABC-type multidrug transport system fused ATPase/permease subunit [Prauserella sediminis]MCR3722956.1 ABC-type multidrug transport system, ATPase and permease component [Prauserella flava]MCR3737368.1 ABC-type multidrug transport system, ATPase and permease component [Prauserella salsuginis]
MDGSWSLMSGAMRAADAPKGLHSGTVRRVAAFARPHWRRLAVFLALTVVAAVIAVSTPLLAGRVVDQIVGGGAVSAVVWLALAIAGLAVADAAVGLAERWQSAHIGEGLIFDLRRAVFEHVQRMPIAFFTRTRTGALVSRLNNDVIGAQRTFTATLSGLVTNVIQLVLSVAVMVTLSWQVTLLALVLLPIFVIPARRIARRMADLQRESAEQNASMTTQMTERFSAPGATLVKLFGRPRDEASEFAERAGKVRDLGVRTAMLTRWFMTTLTLVSALALALVYGLGGWLALDGQLAAGTVVSLALLLTRLYTPLTALANVRVDVMTALVSFERIFEVLDLDPMITEKERPRELPDGAVSVEFDAVRFAYPSPHSYSLASLEDVAALDHRGGEEVLHGVSFRAEAGEMVALVGPSGAGKSTIASLVPRLYDVDAGAVRLSDVDVRDLGFDTMKSAVGVVTQDGHLFHDTIRANLAYVSPGVADADIWHALDRARLTELVRSLPDGLDTVVGERGYRLSGGERQRLTIARLLLAQPRVVVLDEATAHLDSESEVAVSEALAEALAGRTSLVIAHRLSTIRAADRICVVAEGRVVEQGTHDELLAADGRYAQLYRTQFRDGAGEPADGPDGGTPTGEPAGDEAVVA